MKSIKRLPMAVAAAALIAAAVPEATPLVGEAAYAQNQQAAKQKKTRKVPALTEANYKLIQKAQEAMELKDYVKADGMIEDVLGRKKVNDYEKAVAWQVRAMISYEQDKTQDTINAYRQILNYADSIPEALELQMLFGLAQLYFSVENYDESVKYIKIWESRSTIIGVTHLMFIAQLNYVRGDYQGALDYTYRAIADAEAADTVEVKETWYQLVMSAHWELDQFTKVRDVLEILLVNWPKPLYWTQLAGVYGELGEEEISFSLTEAAYRAGYLDDKEQQLVNVAQILIARSAPIKATWVLEKAFEEERVEETARNLKTLGQAYMMASEFERAIAPLEKSAGKDADGDLWFQIAQVQMQLDRHADAVVSFNKSIKALTGDKDKKSVAKILAAHMQIGTANTELKKFDDARKSFATAKRLAKTQKQRRTVVQWENYLKGEEAREKTLTGEGS